MGPVLATLQKAILSRWNRDSTAYDSFFFYHRTYGQGKAGFTQTGGLVGPASRYNQTSGVRPLHRDSQHIDTLPSQARG